MSQPPTTKLKVFVALIISVLVLVTLRSLGFIDLHLSTYSGQMPNDARHNTTGYQRLDIVKKEDILQKEPEYRKITTLGNLKTVANPKNSYIEIRNKKTQYHIGDTIEIYVQLRDSRNKSITKGGDVLRIWIIEESLNASAAGHVIDLNNGSFLGFVEALWVGSPNIKVAIGCTKEHRIISTCLSIVKNPWNMSAKIGQYSGMIANSLLWIEKLLRSSGKS
ncbi:NXPE family member 3 [Mizuhopecten yessoensis]|uniref:NXPE family member 3 n=1 Tax=Mizuhopecten yessoensis TaxID=6573 RepID=A0A210PFC3_MIZYE|nr:NXPE family member 3 [Mizuhopecten yessoensis]